MQIADQLFDQITPFLDNLAGRWRDESKYEDFKDYVAAAKAATPPGFDFLSLTQRPFTLTLTRDGKKYQFKATARKITMDVYS